MTETHSSSSSKFFWNSSLKELSRCGISGLLHQHPSIASLPLAPARLTENQTDTTEKKKNLTDTCHNRKVLYKEIKPIREVF